MVGTNVIGKMNQNEGGSNEQHASASQPPSGKQPRRRPIKQSPGVVPQTGTEKKKEVGAWVLLDGDGNTQEITQRDVKILLGGRSADSVLAENTPHPIAQFSDDRNVRSDTGTNLEPIIQSSLLLLRRDESVGEQATQRQLGLERKTGNMLVYISQLQMTDNENIESEPSVRFINVDTERVELWRHSRDFNRIEVNFDASTSKETSPVAQETFVRETFPEITSSTNNHAIQHILEPSDQTPISKQDKSQIILNRLVPLPKSKTSQPNTSSMPEEYQFSGPFQRCMASQSGFKSNAVHVNVDKHQELANRNEAIIHEEKHRMSHLLSESRKSTGKDRSMNAEHEEKFVREWNKCEHEQLSEPAMKAEMECISSHGQKQTFRELKRDIQDLKIQMFESECTLKQSIAKYISDKNLEKQLLNAVESYSRKRFESEHKMQILAQDIIDEQLDQCKNQQHISEANAMSLQKRNRQLEEENIALLKKMEKLELRLNKQPPDVDIHTLTKEESCFIQNNKKLRAKLSFSQSQVEAMQGQLQEAQCRADNFAAQVRCLRTEMEKHKFYRGRMETDHEIECTSYKEELSAKRQLLRESMEAANILVDDMNLLKTQLKQSNNNNVQINWNKLLVQPMRNNSLTDLVHICRGCISELGKELITTQNHLQSTTKDLDQIREETANIRQVLNETIKANNMLKAQLEKAIADKVASEELIHRMVEQGSQLQEHLTIEVHKRMALEVELSQLQSNSDAEKQQDKLGEKVGRVVQATLASSVKEDQDARIKCLTEENQKLEQDLEQLKLKVGSDEERKNDHEIELKVLQNCNLALKKEIDLLLNVNMPSTTGVNVCDKLFKLEAELKKEIVEKVFLAAELQVVKADYAALIDSQQSYFTNIQLMQNDLELLMQENAALKDERDNYQRTITCLEYDRFNIMGHQNSSNTKTENQIQVMQAALIEKQDVGKELARIIDQNKKTMVKLETSLVEKDVLVSQLENKVAQLHTSSELESKDWQLSEEQLMANLESIRRDGEKACDSMKHQLMTAKNEIESLKKRLSEKTFELDSYKELEKELDAYSVTEIHQREEIANLKGKLLEHDNITKQRDKLVESQHEFLSEIELLHENLMKRQHNINSLTHECKTQAVKIAELEEKLKYTNNTLVHTVSNASARSKHVEELKQELKEATEKLLEYEQHIANMDRGIEQHVSKIEREREHEIGEKCKLNEAVDHLKSVIDAKQLSLDEALKEISSMRKMEKDLKNMLEEERKQQMKTENAFKMQNAVLEKAEHLSEQLNKAREQYATLNDEYCQYQNTVAHNEEEIRYAMAEQNARVKELEQHMIALHAEKKQLMMELGSAQQSMIFMQEHIKLVSKNTNGGGRTLSHVHSAKSINNDKFGSRMSILQPEEEKIQEIHKLRETDNSAIQLDLQHARRQIQVISKQLEKSLNALEKERSNNKILIKQLKSEHTDQMKHLLKEIKELGLNKQHAEQVVSEKEKAIEQLELEHEDLSEKLLRAIRMVIDEKTLRQRMENRSREFSPVISQLEADKANHTAKIQQLQAEMKQLKQSIANTSCKTIQSESQMEYELQDFGSTFLVSSKTSSSHTRIKDPNIQKQRSILTDELVIKKDVIKQYEEQSTILQERVQRLSKELNETRNTLLCQRQDLGKQEKTIVSLQAEKHQLGLRLIELNGLERVESHIRRQLEHASGRYLGNSETNGNIQQQLAIKTSLPKTEE